MRAVSPLTPKAALFGVLPEDAEVLHLLLDVLGWDSATIYQLSDEKFQAAQLIFVGLDEASAITDLSNKNQVIKFVVIADSYWVDELNIKCNTYFESLASPIEIQAAENLINAASANFIFQNKN